MIMDMFSHSRIGAYESCPRKFAFRYVEEVPARGDSIEAFLGKRVHDALEDLYQKAHTGLVLTEADLLQSFDDLWNVGWSAEVRVAAQGLTPEYYQSACRQLLALYHRRHAPFTKNRLVATEQRIEIPLDEAGQYRLQGFVDRIDEVAPGIIEIHDYKTNNRLPTQADRDADRQLAIYELGARELYPETKEVTLVWHYLRFDREIRSHRTVDQLNAVRRELLRKVNTIVEAMQKGHFPTRTSRLCDWCDYQHCCPAMQRPPTEA